MVNAPLFVSFAERIKKMILSGTLPVGSYLPSIRKMQEDYGLSRNTILSSLRILQEENIIQRQGATRQGYRIVQEPPEYAVEEQQRTSLVKFVLPFNYWMYVGGKLLNAIESMFSEHHASVVFGNNKNSTDEEERLLRRLQTQHSGSIGALILMTASSYDNPNLELLRSIQRAMPVILLDRQIQGCDAHFVGLNNRRIGYQAVTHLVERDYRKIGFVTGYANASSVRDRYMGYLSALHDYGLEHQKCWEILNNDLYRAIESIDEPAQTIADEVFALG